MEFKIIGGQIYIIPISEPHKKKTFPWGKIPELAPPAYSTIKVEIAGIGISVLLCSYGTDHVYLLIEYVALKDNLRIILPYFSA
jgi:hypothetical protein